MSSSKYDTLWYQANLDIYLNRWFASYDEARGSLEREGGFLLPFRNHFYVCESGAIRALGLDPEDPDWTRIGFDCVRPADEQAYRRLEAKRAAARARRGLGQPPAGQ